MNNNVSKGRLIQVAQSYTNGGDIRRLESGEFGLGLDEGQERLWIGSNSGNIQVVTERNIAQLAVPDGSIGRTELDGEINTLLDNISSVTNMPEATTSTKGLMSSNDKTKLNSIETGANNTVIVNNLTSLSTTSALSAYQGKVLKDAIDVIAGGGSTVAVVDNLTSTDTTASLSANQGRILKGLVDSKAGTTTATTSANGLMSASDKQKLDNMSNSTTTVVNTLTSTSTTNALSAYQGKVLNESKLSGYQSNISTSATGTSFGINNVSSGDYSLTIGYNNTASNFATFAGGISSKASGGYATAIGNEANANVFSSFVVGKLNNPLNGQVNSYSGTADAFVVGNGFMGYDTSNAFRVTFDGKVYGRSAYNSSGADYAEYFEWLDSNVDNEDRVGYFVTLDGDKIRKANSLDTYILGIISANPSVVGNVFSEGWQAQYIRDEFDRVQYHYVDVEHEELDENGNKTVVIKKEYHPKYNPEYNSTTPYISREDRPEWDAVGIVGQLLVRDDGTCKVNGFAKVGNTDGEATHSDEPTNYRVIERRSENIIKVFVK